MYANSFIWKSLEIIVLPYIYFQLNPDFHSSIREHNVHKHTSSSDDDAAKNAILVRQFVQPIVYQQELFVHAASFAREFLLLSFSLHTICLRFVSFDIFSEYFINFICSKIEQIDRFNILKFKKKSNTRIYEYLFFSRVNYKICTKKS